MKQALVLFVLFIFFGCSSDDDESESYDLLYGQWYRIGLCEEQNSLLLTASRDYTDFVSGAIDCNDPAPDTFKHTGKYQVNDMFIKFNILTSERVIDGTDLTIEEFEDSSVKHQITELSSTKLTIKSFRDNGGGVIENLYTANYEH